MNLKLLKSLNYQIEQMNLYFLRNQMNLKILSCGLHLKDLLHLMYQMKRMNLKSLKWLNCLNCLI